MQLGGRSGGRMAEINVTPMIDVILVLLIIFMLVVPTVKMGYEVIIPPKPDEQAQADRGPNHYVFSLDVDGSVYVNREKIEMSELQSYVREAAGPAGERPIFFVGAPELPYPEALHFIDALHSAGANRISVVPDRELIRHVRSADI